MQLVNKYIAGIANRVVFVEVETLACAVASRLLGMGLDGASIKSQFSSDRIIDFELERTARRGIWLRLSRYYVSLIDGTPDEALSSLACAQAERLWWGRSTLHGGTPGRESAAGNIVLM